MARIKDDLLGQQDTKMEYYSKFIDAMYEVLNPEPKLSESDIEKMEQDYCNSQKAPFENIHRSVPKSMINTTETTTRRAA